MKYTARPLLASAAGAAIGFVISLWLSMKKQNKVHDEMDGGHFAVDFEPRALYVPIIPQPSREIVTHRGRCHCGSIQFEVEASSNVVAFDCNCSNCAMRRNTHFVVPKAKLRMLSGKQSMTCYRFGSGVAKHWFCSVCGISPYYEPRSNPDGYAVTVHCIQRGSISSIQVKQFDGVNWEAFIDKSGIRSFSAT